MSTKRYKLDSTKKAGSRLYLSARSPVDDRLRVSISRNAFVATCRRTWSSKLDAILNNEGRVCIGMLFEVGRTLCASCISSEMSTVAFLMILWLSISPGLGDLLSSSINEISVYVRGRVLVRKLVWCKNNTRRLCRKALDPLPR